MEVRSISTDLTINEENLSVEGLVNKTEEWSKVLGNRRKFREKVVKGAFKRAIKNAEKIDFLAEHDRNLLLASTENGSLDLYEDDEGLQMRAMIAPTSYGKDIHALIKSKLKNHMSFGFKVIKDSWEKGLDGIYYRTIEELALTEVSAVRNPCYSQTAIEARGIEVIQDVEIPELENSTEERNMEFNLEELKASLKAELLSELQATNTSTETQVEVIESVDKVANTVAEVVENVVESEKAIAETEDTSLKAVDENTTVTISESVEVKTVETQEDGSIQETSEEVEVKTEVVDEAKKFDAISYIKAIKENQKRRL